VQREEIDLVIPVQGDSEQLKRTVDLIDRHTDNYKLHVVVEPSLNVSEARQLAMNEVTKNSIICFLDYDSEMIHDGWLDAMYKTLSNNPEAGAVFANENWGNEEVPPEYRRPFDHEIKYGPAACMMLEKARIPSNIIWDPTMALMNGWLGGDFEEVEYCYQLVRNNLKLIRCADATFHHTGGRTSMENFRKSDRQRTVRVMDILLKYKFAKAPGDDDYFKALNYVRAHPHDDNMLHPNANLRDCYYNVIKDNGLSHVRSFQRLGLV
jgi:hypothetical protein